MSKPNLARAGAPAIFLVAFSLGAAACSTRATQGVSDASTVNGPSIADLRVTDASSSHVNPSDTSDASHANDLAASGCLMLGQGGSCSTNPASPYHCCAPAVCDDDNGHSDPTCIIPAGGSCTAQSDCGIFGQCTNGTCGPVACLDDSLSDVCSVTTIPCCYTNAKCSSTTIGRCCVPDGQIAADVGHCCGGNATTITPSGAVCTTVTM